MRIVLTPIISVTLTDEVTSIYVDIKVENGVFASDPLTILPISATHAMYEPFLS
jgi:hypothetical protein